MSFFSAYLYDQNTNDALTWNGYGALVPMHDLVPYAFLIAFGVVSIGLIFFKSWARTGFLFLTAIGFLLSPVIGLSVQTGVDSLLSYFINLSDGAILVMAYLTSINNEFQPAT